MRKALRGSVLRVGDDALLDFALALHDHETAGSLDRLGRDLWRVGLVADAGMDWQTRLERNREAVRTLAHSARLSAGERERIAALKTDDATARRLERFFAGRPLLNVRAWSRTLADGTDTETPPGPTFDQWKYPQFVEANITKVIVEPFTDAKGNVRKYTKLVPLEAGGELFAPFGKKGMGVTVHWSTEPPPPQGMEQVRGAYRSCPTRVTLTRTRTTTIRGLRPATEQGCEGHGQSATLPLDGEFDDALLEKRLRVRVSAMVRGEELRSDGKPVADVSDAFYLGNEAYLRARWAECPPTHCAHAGTRPASRRA